MAVFENLRNFIRHGKQAAAYAGPEGNQPLLVVSPAPNDQETTNITSTPLDKRGSVSEPNLVTQTPAEQHHQRKEDYNDAVKQIIAEENEERSKIHQYPGLERFKLIEKMGDGAFSVVYKAYDRVNKNYVAVKVIHKQELSSSQHSTILKEVAIMRQLQHKNIVELADFKETPEYYFIVLELIPGGELFHQIVRLTYFSEDLARHVIVQVAEAVRYLHEVAGVVHRDIKPENLLFYPTEFVPSKVKHIRKGEDESKEDEGEFIPNVGGGGIGVIKLADFGLSKIIWDSKTMTPCGTVGYTAPEIVKDERYSKSVDMWALGCVLYTVLCGFPPFYDESIEVLTEKVAKGQYTFLSPWWDEISREAKDLVSHLLTVDPETRYTIDQFLQHPWITGRKPAASTAAAAAAKAMAGSNPIPSTAISGTTTSTATINAIPERSQAQSASTKEFPTPVVVTLKEVFDVSNAVHRMEEENARNVRWKGKFQSDLAEEEEEEEEESNYKMDISESNDPESLKGVEQRLERVSVGKAVPASSKAAPSVPRSSRKHHQNPNPHNFHGQFATGGLFELNLKGATLLERRKRAGKEQPTIPPSLVT